MALAVVREGPVKITKAKIDTVWRARTPNQRLLVADAECRGLALVVHPSSMSWRFDYKPRGVDPATGKRFASRSITIGNPQSHSPDDARAEANKLKGQTKAGDDPGAKRRAKLAEQAKKRARTMRHLLAEYEAALPNRTKLRGGQGKLSPRGIKSEIAQVTAAIKAMSAIDKPADEITAAEIKKMLQTVADKPASARHRYGALSRLYDWAQDEGLAQANPCLLVAKARRPRAVQPRSTFHTPQQLGALWQAIEKAVELQQAHKDLMHFLIAVPCRRGEASNVAWQDINLADATWSQLGTSTKNGDPHRLYLHELALELLKRRHELMGKPPSGLVFPAPRSGKPIDTFSDIKAAIDKALEPPFAWRAHDHRRSFTTALGEAGIHEAVVDSMLNHRQSATRGGVLGVYQRAQRWPEQVEAMKAWGELLKKAIKSHKQSSHPAEPA